MPQTLVIPFSRHPRKNRRRQKPWKKILLLAAILLGIATAIALCAPAEPPRDVADTGMPTIPEISCEVLS
jgi:hypothetical protein